ncbi:MAG: hypothetical protein JW913_02275, partial [Chitinispirillaceae bacterium]|nr:hypothetical protein [Chitinispirillaceae bacterium]
VTESGSKPMIKSPAVLLTITLFGPITVFAQSDNGAPPPPPLRRTDSTRVSSPVTDAPYCTIGNLPPGKHRLSLKVSGFRPRNSYLTFGSHDSAVARFTLEPANRRRMHRWIVRAAAGAVAAISCGMGVYYDIEAQKALERYHTATAADRTVHDANWKAFRASVNRRNALYIFSGVISASVAISIPLEAMP